MKDSELDLKQEIGIDGIGKVLAKETDFSGNIISVFVEFSLKDGKKAKLEVPPELIKKI